MTLRLTRDTQGKHIITCTHLGQGKFEVLYRFNGAQVVRQVKSEKDMALEAFGALILYLRTKRGLKLHEVVRRT